MIQVRFGTSDIFYLAEATPDPNISHCLFTFQIHLLFCTGITDYSITVGKFIWTVIWNLLVPSSELNPQNKF